ncbi:hypothetical protein DI392_11710 [Vibrio albus]|uniref:Uncharacterized protein n=1 Tax=Vibrio albus TaxID=2200953 RepID=A0A2U3B8B1_9VIBR|nr:hypothetical protein [Vibrio albus]PWI32975.1 hypothetical protein DI392_11710 [Vibrio albus]
MKKLTFALPILVIIGAIFTFTMEGNVNANSTEDINSATSTIAQAGASTLAKKEQHAPKVNRQVFVLSADKKESAPLIEHQPNHSVKPNTQQKTENTTAPVSVKTQIVSEQEDEYSTNSKPIINVSVQQSLQNIIYGWELTEGNPANQSLDFSGLFSDDENDLLSYSAYITTDTIKVNTLLDSIQLSGSVPDPEEGGSAVILQIGAKDHFHDDEETPWTIAQFNLPFIERAEDENSHPLVGQTLYYINTSNQLGNKQYSYQVAYCQALLFINGSMFFAASKNKINCPDKSQLKNIGTYSINEDTLIATNTQEQNSQTWTIKHKKIYDEQHTDILATVTQSSSSDTYLLQSRKNDAEQRLFPTRKQQLLPYYYPIATNQYAQYNIGLHLDHYTYIQSPNGEYYDADINFYLPGTNISCGMIEPYFESFTIAGIDIYGDLITTAGKPGNSACFEYQTLSHPQSVFIDFNFEEMTELIDGEIYSIVGKIKPQYRNKWEDIKFNAYWNEDNNIFSLD